MNMRFKAEVRSDENPVNEICSVPIAAHRFRKLLMRFTTEHTPGRRYFGLNQDAWSNGRALSPMGRELHCWITCDGHSIRGELAAKTACEVIQNTIEKVRPRLNLFGARVSIPASPHAPGPAQGSTSPPHFLRMKFFTIFLCFFGLRLLLSLDHLTRYRNGGRLVTFPMMRSWLPSTLLMKRFSSSTIGRLRREAPPFSTPSLFAPDSAPSWSYPCDGKQVEYTLTDKQFMTKGGSPLIALHILAALPKTDPTFISSSLSPFLGYEYKSEWEPLEYGTTATLALYLPDSKDLIVANVGSPLHTISIEMT